MDLVEPSLPVVNQPFFTDTFRTYPIGSSLGAEIHYDLTKVPVDQLKQALAHHKVLIFRNQEMNEVSQTRLTERMGGFAPDFYTGDGKIQRIVKEADSKTTMVFGNGWHTDSPFLECPPSTTILRSVEVPPYGGDTTFYNTAFAYQVLSNNIKDLLQSLQVHMTGHKLIEAMERSQQERFDDTELSLDYNYWKKGNIHPLVRTHPLTGEKSLYFDDVYVRRLIGVTKWESDNLCEFLIKHITQEIFCARLRWEPNMVVLWDNRVCIHRAFNDFDGYRREMHRSIVIGEKPQ